MFFNKLHSILINSFLNNLFDLKSCGETSSKKVVFLCSSLHIRIISLPDWENENQK